MRIHDVEKFRLKIYSLLSGILTNTCTHHEHKKFKQGRVTEEAIFKKVAENEYKFLCSTGEEYTCKLKDETRKKVVYIGETGKTPKHTFVFYD